MKKIILIFILVLILLPCKVYAETEEKNAKLYKTLGATMGLAFAIILI